MIQVDVTVDKYEDSLIFHMLLLIFMFRSTFKKGRLDENDVRHCYGNFFCKCHSESYLITTMFNVPSQQLRDTFIAAF